MMHKAWHSVEEVPYCLLRSSIKFQDHTGQKIDDLNPTWVILIGWSQLSNPSDLPCFFSSDQAALWMGLSIRQYVCLSVTTLSLFLSSFHHEIFRSNYHWQKWCPCKKSRSEVKRQGQRAQKKFYPNLGFSGPKLQFWIHRWLRNCAQSLKLHRRRALFKVILEISWSHRTKTSSIFTRIERFWTVTPVWIHQWFWNDAQSLK